MNQSAVLSEAHKGFSTRHGQLAAWTEHVQNRLGRIRKQSQRHNTAGVHTLLEIGRAFLKLAVSKLAVTQPYLNSLDIADETAVGLLHLDLKNAEAGIRAVDQRILPILRSRSESDPKYDEFTQRFMSDLKLGTLPSVTSHLQHNVPGLKVDMLFRQPIFLFSPSIRSLDALSLLYHEIGHVYWACQSDRPMLRQALLRHMLPLDPSWTSYAQKNDGVSPSKVTLGTIQREFPILWAQQGEIAADAFAGMVGGHAYTSSLCNVFLFKPSIHQLTSDTHPPAVWRVWFSRLATRVGGSPAEDNAGPPFAAWDVITGLPVPDKTKSGPLQNGDAAGAFLSHLRDELTRSGIPLSQMIPRHPIPPPANYDWSKASVPEILHVASKYRTEVDYSTYCEWERQIAPTIGLPRT